MAASGTTGPGAVRGAMLQGREEAGEQRANQGCPGQKPQGLAGKRLGVSATGPVLPPQAERPCFW